MGENKVFDVYKGTTAVLRGAFFVRIAVMQPYFMPYAGYFRLFLAADHVVILDDVQFPRRGFVHRNRLADRLGRSTWLTLPLVKQPRRTLIKEMVLSANAATIIERVLNRFQVFSTSGEHASFWRQSLKPRQNQLSAYLVRLLAQTCDYLDLPFEISFAGDLNLPPELRGQQRVLEIVKHLKGSVYINLSGGKALYDPALFGERGLQLAFLQPFQGDHTSMLERVIREQPLQLKNEIAAQLTLERV